MTPTRTTILIPRAVLDDLVAKHGSAAAAAAKCGVDQATFSRWRSGETHPRGTNTIKRLRRLGVIA